MSRMRPRGESISSPHSTYVGHVGRQKPQCTQSSMRLGLGRVEGRRRLGRYVRSLPRSGRVEGAVGVEARLDAAHERLGAQRPPGVDLAAQRRGGVEQHARAAAARAAAVTSSASAASRRSQRGVRGARDADAPWSRAAGEHLVEALLGGRDAQHDRPALARALGGPQLLVVLDDLAVDASARARAPTSRASWTSTAPESPSQRRSRRSASSGRCGRARARRRAERARVVAAHDDGQRLARAAGAGGR